jgi:hypothetical protein
MANNQFIGGGGGGVCLPFSIYYTKMLVKVVFDKTSFVKFKISNNFKQNIDEIMKHIPNNQKSIGKSIPAYGFLKSQEKKSANQKSRNFCQTLVISKKKTMGYLGPGLRIQEGKNDP